MPTYPIACTACGAHSDVYARPSELNQHGQLPCPECGELADQDYAAKRVGTDVRTLTGKDAVSTREFFTQADVGEAVQKMGDVGRECIRSDGSVRFPDTKTADRYWKKRKALRDSGEFV